MPTIVRFEDMDVWKTSRDLTRKIYELTRNDVFSRDFGLRDQMRRASVSIMSNIAEGFESRTNTLFKDYLGRAKASAGELRAQVYVANDIGYINVSEFSELLGICEKCSRQLSKFIQYLEQQPNAIRDEGIEYNV
jgi:four helix bundle protein